MTNKLPKGWGKCSLEDLCFLDNGKKVCDVSLPLLDVKYLRGKKEAETITKGVLVNPNEYMILVDGENSGEVFKSKEIGILGTTFKKISFYNNNTIKYALFIIKSCQKLFRNNKKGSAIPHLDKKLFKEYSVNLPPLAEQERIVGKIEELFSAIDNGIKNLNVAKEQIKQYRQSVLHSAFTGKLYKTTDWKQVQLKEVCENIQYGYTEKSSKIKNGPKFLRITDIQDDSVNWESVPYCSIPQTLLDNYKLKNGDFVFARTGATVGKSYLIEDIKCPAVFASYLIRIRFKTKIISKFVKYFFQSPIYWAQITDKQVGIGQPNVNGTKLGQLQISLPSLPEQLKIVDMIETHFKVVNKMETAVQESLKQAEQLKQSILKKAFSGKLVPQDPNDEPASVLLARIKAEKQSQLKKGKSK